MTTERIIDFFSTIFSDESDSVSDNARKNAFVESVFVVNSVAEEWCKIQNAALS